MVQDYLGLVPKPGHRVEGGGATGGICFQEAWKSVASGHMDVCVAYGFETMSHVETWKGNEFIALASDVSFDYPVGGFYSGYYAMMVTRHMKEFGTTVEQMAAVSVKNHLQRLPQPLCPEAQPLHHPGCAQCAHGGLAADPPGYLRDVGRRGGGDPGFGRRPAAGWKQPARRSPARWCKVTGIGRGTDAMRMADRPHIDYDDFMRDYATEQERSSDETRAYYRQLWDHGTRYPGVHSFRAGRTAGNMAYKHGRHLTTRCNELDFVELHDAYTSSEIQTYEDLGLCRYGEGGPFAASGKAFMPGIDYGLKLPETPVCPVNPSGGLIACGHPVGATGLMQGVFAIWQLQGSIAKHFGDATLQVQDARRGAIHSHAGTGTYVTVSILEQA